MLHIKKSVDRDSDIHLAPHEITLEISKEEVHLSEYLHFAGYESSQEAVYQCHLHC